MLLFLLDERISTSLMSVQQIWSHSWLQVKCLTISLTASFTSWSLCSLPGNLTVISQASCFPPVSSLSATWSYIFTVQTWQLYQKSHIIFGKKGNKVFSLNCAEVKTLLSYFPVNTSDVLTIESDTENRFVLEQLWSLGFLHQAVWLGMYFNIDSKNLSPSHNHQMTTISCNAFSLNSGLAFSWFPGLGGWFAYGLHKLAQQSPRL